MPITLTANPGHQGIVDDVWAAVGRKGLQLRQTTHGTDTTPDFGKPPMSCEEGGLLAAFDYVAESPLGELCVTVSYYVTANPASEGIERLVSESGAPDLDRIAGSYDFATGVEVFVLAETFAGGNDSVGNVSRGSFWIDGSGNVIYPTPADLANLGPLAALDRLLQYL